MPRKPQSCTECGEMFRPRPERGQDIECASCLKKRPDPNAAHVPAHITHTDGSTSPMPRIDEPEETGAVLDYVRASELPPPRRRCACDKDFVPPLNDPTQERCAECRKLVARPRPSNPYKEGRQERISTLTPPLRVGVFDLETWGLDRAWGVTMVASVLIHDGKDRGVQTFSLRDTAPYKAGRRSDDMELGKTVLGLLADCDVLVAHNGRRFDIPWLNSVALKFGMPRLITKKLIDPVQIARNRYQLGWRGNSLSSMASFVGLPEEKMPVPPDVWRYALLDDDAGSWNILAERCESDVRLLNAVACKVVPDAGLIDSMGSGGRAA